MVQEWSCFAGWIFQDLSASRPRSSSSCLVWNWKLGLLACLLLSTHSLGLSESLTTWTPSMEVDSRLARFVFFVAMRTDSSIFSCLNYEDFQRPGESDYNLLLYAHWESHDNTVQQEMVPEKSSVQILALHSRCIPHQICQQATG